MKNGMCVVEGWRWTTLLGGRIRMNDISHYFFLVWFHLCFNEEISFRKRF